MSKTNILNNFKDINQVYNNSMAFDSLSMQLDLFESEIRADERKNYEQDAYMRGYNQGYDKGESDGRFFERAELQKAFEKLHGNEYSWQEICDMADKLKSDKQ